MSEVVRLKGLLFSTDAQVLGVMNEVLDNFEIETAVCLEPASALDVVTTTKVDTLIMDWTGSEESIQVLSAMRNSQQNAKSTVMVLVNGASEMQAATQAGANFIVYKPMNVDQATRFVRAAYGNMLLQRRRAVRCSVDIPVVASVLGEGQVEGKITNLSVLGLAFICDHAIGMDQQLAIGFKLPQTSVNVRVTGRVVNAINPDGHTRVGVSFSFVPPEEFELLEEWITNHLPTLPNRLMPPDHRQAAN